MQKEKKVKSYTRRTKSGKTVVVRAHTAKYDAAEEAKELAKKKGAGDELLKRKEEFDEDVLSFKDWKKELKDTTEELAHWRKYRGRLSRGGLTTTSDHMEYEKSSYRIGALELKLSYLKSRDKNGNYGIENPFKGISKQKLDAWLQGKGKKYDAEVRELIRKGQRESNQRHFASRLWLSTTTTEIPKRLSTDTSKTEPKVKKTSPAKSSSSEPAFTAAEYKAWYHWDQENDPKNKTAQKVAKALRAQMGRSAYNKYFNEMSDNYSARGHISAFKKLGSLGGEESITTSKKKGTAKKVTSTKETSNEQTPKKSSTQTSRTSKEVKKSINEKMRRDIKDVPLSLAKKVALDGDFSSPKEARIYLSKLPQKSYDSYVKGYAKGASANERESSVSMAQDHLRKVKRDEAKDAINRSTKVKVGTKVYYVEEKGGKRTYRDSKGNKLPTYQVMNVRDKINEHLSRKNSRELYEEYQAARDSEKRSARKEASKKSKTLYEKYGASPKEVKAFMKSNKRKWSWDTDSGRFVTNRLPNGNVMKGFSYVSLESAIKRYQKKQENPKNLFGYNNFSIFAGEHQKWCSPIFIPIQI